MATTNFEAGTVIASTWLNDVDEAVYTTLPTKAPIADATFTGTTTVATLAATAGTVATLGSTDLTATNITASTGIDTGTLDATGAAVFGSTASFAEIVTASKGIKFPAVQVASADVNTLDDYEEGTWTPSVGGTATYVGQIGTYTKIGRSVSVYFDIDIDVIGTGSTSQIAGLPFAGSASMNFAGSVGYFDNLASSVYWLGIIVNSGNSYLELYKLAAAAASTTSAAVLGDGTRLVGQINYTV